jgi:hypothetical protein
MIKTVVITGGPCAGKTSVVSHIERTLTVDMVTVPDVARHIQQVFPRPEMQSDVGTKLAVMRHLRTAAARAQDELEAAYAAVARKLRVKMILCDGGILDGAAYWPEGMANFLSTMNLRKDEICGGFRSIIHLQSLAISQPELYQQLSQQRRHPPLGEAQIADEIIGQVWSSHSNYHRVSTDATESEVQKKVVELIRFSVPETAQAGQDEGGETST